MLQLLAERRSAASCPARVVAFLASPAALSEADCDSLQERFVSGGVEFSCLALAAPGEIPSEVLHRVGKLAGTTSSGLLCSTISG
jgi:hypothetical protein